jgi:hypothetical protein
MYYIGLDLHKKTISYCVKDVSGQVHNRRVNVFLAVPSITS